MVKFLRRISNRYSKLGKRRKKKQIWRRPTGRDNKMRERRKGYPARVSIGYKSDKKDQKEIIVIKNVGELENIKKNVQVIVGNVGKKKKIEIVKKAKEKKIEIQNLNIKNFLKEVEKNKKTKKTESLNAKEDLKKSSKEKKKIEVKKETPEIKKTPDKK